MTEAITDEIADLFAAHHVQLERRARRLLGSDADADDAVQEVMLTLLDAPQLLSSIDRLGGWLLTVVRRRAIDLIRSDSRRRERETVEGIEELFSGAADPEALMRRDDVAREVAQAVEELSDDQRYAFVANALEGLTFQEMSDESGVPMGTLMARKKKAVDTIRGRLRRSKLLEADR